MKLPQRLGFLTFTAIMLPAGGWASGCAGQPETFGSSSGSGGQGGTTSSGDGGSGGQGGSSSGTGGSSSPCAIDCTQIQAPMCQVAQCNAQLGQCEVVADTDGTVCDDGVFCTVDDGCVSGLCVGGPDNDCGITAEECEEIICSEQSQTCATQAQQNGAACTPTDQCQESATCTNGLCTGTAKDCFFQPVPDDCHVSECNPQNGQCEPVPGNEGAACTDVNDLCTVAKTCTAGVCQGGVPMNCSQLTQDCVLGVCDTNTGQCTTQSLNNGDPCDDLNACTTNELCQSSSCTGGQPVTQCTHNDGCCPSGCNANNDLDCACNLGKIRITELFIGTPDYLLLHNPTTCAMDLDPMEILFDDSTSTDLTFPLPTHVLAAGASVYVIEASPVGTDIDTGSNIMFSGTRGGAAILCEGSCSSSANVVDVVAFSEGEPHGALPSGITFNPAGLTGINASTQSYLRVNTTGTTPNFLASDWTLGAKSKP
jgi:hypothetical protein